MKTPSFLQLIPNSEHSNQLLRTRWNVPLAHFIFAYLKTQKSPIVERFTPARTANHILSQDAKGTSLQFDVAFKDSLSQYSTNSLVASCTLDFGKTVKITLNNLPKPVMAVTQATRLSKNS